MITIDALPKEILLKILSQLEQSDKYNSVCVSKKFYSFFIPELWKKIEIHSKDMLTKFIYGLNNSEGSVGLYVKHAVIGHCSIDNDAFLAILPLIPNIEIFKIDGAEGLTDKSVTQIFPFCKQLKSLWLSQAQVSYQSALSLAQCHQLQSLSLKSCTSMTSRVLLPFSVLPIKTLSLCDWNRYLTVNETGCDLQLFTHLTSLSIASVIVLNPQFFYSLLKNTNGLSCFPQLKVLHLEGTLSPESYDDRGIALFLKTHPGIRDLSLIICNISDNSINTIAHHLPDLECLWIADCIKVSAQAVRQMIYRCPKLSNLRIDCRGFAYYDFPEVHHNPDFQMYIWNRIDLNRIRANQPIRT